METVPNPDTMSLEEIAVYLRSKGVPSSFCINLVAQIFETRMIAETAIDKAHCFEKHMTGVN